MAYVEMVYIECYCECRLEDEFDMQCFTDAAEDGGCVSYTHDKRYTDEKGILHIPSYACKHARTNYIHKGVTAKSYEIEPEHESDYDDGWYKTAKVYIGRRGYDCVKVKLDGKCIFNSYDDEKVE